MATTSTRSKPRSNGNNQRYQLTWHKARKCWKKMYGGKTYYLGKGKCNGKTDSEGYQLALTEWEAVKRFADDNGPNPYTEAGEFIPAEYQLRLADFLAMRQRIGPNGNQQPAGESIDPDKSPWMASDYTRHGFTLATGLRTHSGDVSLADLFAEYLRQRESEVQSNALSVKQYAQDKAKLNDFEGFAKHYGRAMLSEIDGPFLQSYRVAQQRLTTVPNPADRISQETARKRLQTILKVWRWAYKQEYLDALPRVLDREYAKVKIDRPKPRFWEPAELRQLFAKASQRTKLYIALACNCGYTQAEIATLEWEMIDPKTREVRRERPKSGQPQVHKLWPLTLELLRAESKTTSGLCLVGAKGNPLLTQEIKADGNITHVDSIRLAFNRTLKKTKLDNTGRSFKHIRKTSANAIAEKYEDNRLVDLFLGHSTHAMRNHYADDHYKGLFSAIDWLESYYGLKLEAETATAKPSKAK